MQLQNWVFLAYTVAALGLILWVLRIVRRGRGVKVTDAAILALVLLGLVYDNAMLSLAASFGESTAMEIASYPRYILHGTFTPLLVLFAARCAERMDVPGYRRRELITLWGVFTFATILLGLMGETELHLTPVTEDGVLSYRHLGGGAPIAEILTVIGVLIIGGTMQRYMRWPVIFLGGAQMFVFALFWADDAVIANFGELVLLTSMVWTAQEAVRRVGLEREARRSDALSRRERGQVDA